MNEEKIRQIRESLENALKTFEQKLVRAVEIYDEMYDSICDQVENAMRGLR